MRKMQSTRRALKRSVSTLCAAAVVVTGLAGQLPQIFAAQDLWEGYESHTSIIPSAQGITTTEMLNWTPESDPDTRYNRSVIPMAKDRFTGPQVVAQSNPDAKLLVAPLTNANFDQTPAQGNDSFDSYAYGYWQYTDSYVYWGSSDRGQMFAAPTPDIIDSAHRNGVPVCPTISFQKDIQTMIVQNPDGSFPVGDKMAQFALYYGFDGYFFNVETGYNSAKLREMMQYCHKKYPWMIFSWYDALTDNNYVDWRNQVDDTNKGWLTPNSEGIWAVDEFFLNYNWGWQGTSPTAHHPDDYAKVAKTIATMESIGRSPFDAYAGVDVQQRGGKSDFRDHVLLDEQGKLKLSLALFCPNSTMGFASDPVDFHRAERDFYVGPEGDPTIHEIDPMTDQDDYKWVGLSRFFADQSVITQAPFVTNFNTGHGKQWYINGAVSRDTGWSNRSIQEILPTWTWTVRSEGSKLTGNYDFDTAYNGGNSIKFEGDLDAGEANANKIMLYSTKVSNAKTAEIVFKANKPGSKVQLGLCYGDTYDEFNFKYYDLQESAAENGWTKGVVDLSEDEGKEIIAVALRVTSDQGVSDYKLNVGSLSLLDTQRSPLSAPRSITLDEILYTTANEAQVRMYWDKVEDASYYEIYRINGEGEEELISATPNNAYCIAKLVRDSGQTQATIKVLPVNANGVRGEARSMSFVWGMGENDTQTPEAETSVNVALGVDSGGSAVVLGGSGQGDGEPYEKAIDGTEANNSKWCQAGANSGWMAIDIGSEKTVQRWRTEHAEYGGEAANGNTKSYDLQVLKDPNPTQAQLQNASYLANGNNWKTICSIDGNTLPVTDVLVNNPEPARYYRLNIRNSGNSPWAAIRIYEWQMFEDPTFRQTEPIPVSCAFAENNDGANDTFTLLSIPVKPLSKKVRLYTSMDATEPIAEKQSVAASGDDRRANVTFEGLDFGTAGAGRIYYTTMDVSGARESARMSVPFEAESAQKTPVPSQVEYYSYTAKDSNGANQSYSDITVKGLQANDMVYVYDSMSAQNYRKVSVPVPQGGDSAVIERVALDQNNPQVVIQIKRDGMKLSDKIQMAAVVNKDALKAVLDEARAIEKRNYTDLSFQALQTAIGEAQAVVDNASATVEQVQQQTAAVKEAVAALAKNKVVTQVLGAIVEKAVELRDGKALDNTVQVVVNGFLSSLESAQTMLQESAAANDITQSELNAAAVDLLSWMAKVDWKQGDKTALEVAVEIARTINNNLDLYVDTEAFTNAYEKAEQVLSSGNAMQDDVDEAYRALMDAMMNLKMEVNKDILNDMINGVESMDLSGYTADSVQTLQAALTQAKKVNADGNATQQQVDSAVQALSAAKAALVKQPAVEPAPAPEEVPPMVQPAGDGCAPTKTGEASSIALFALTTAAGAVVVLSRRKSKK